MAQAVNVGGLKELTRAFGQMSKDLTDEVRDELLEAVKPVKERAEQLALSRISNLPKSEHPEWHEMRTGLSRARGVVFMVPAHRGNPRRRRRKFADQLLKKAMDPAVDENTDNIIRGVERTLDRLADRNGF